MKKILITIISIVLLMIATLLFTGNSHILVGISKTWLLGKSKPDIDDMKYFDLRKIENGNYKPWLKSKNYNKRKLSYSMQNDIENYGTIAYLVIHNDSIVNEHYWEEYTDTSYSNSFSMAKSYLSAAIGVAIKEGKIKSVNQKIKDFLPWFNNSELDKSLTIKSLLTMSSGIDFGESYTNPLGFQAKSYYGTDLKTLVKDFTLSFKPDSIWKYEGGNSILLGIILEKATKQSISDYFSEKIWSKIGTRKPAFWNLDKKDGMEKTFSAIYSNARDFARMGKLYLNRGAWEGKQIISNTYIQESISYIGIKDSKGKLCNHYGYHWWLGTYNNKPFFSSIGMRGQYVVVVPEDNLIVVRLGHDRPQKKVNNLRIDIYSLLEEAYNIIN